MLGKFHCSAERRTGRSASLATISSVVDIGLFSFAALPFCLGRILEDRSSFTTVIRSHLQATTLLDLHVFGGIDDGIISVFTRA